MAEPQEQIEPQEQGLQERKLQLEVVKLNADIEKLNVSWYKSSDFWKSIVPPILTTAVLLISLYFTVGKSVIDDEKRKLELQKEQLKLEVMRFEDVKNNIQKQIAGSTVNKNILNKQIADLSNQKNSLSKTIFILQSRAKILTGENKNLKSAYSDDTSFYRSELKRAYVIERTYLKKLSDENSKKDVQIAGLLAEIKFLRKRVKLSDNEKLELSGDKAGAAADELTKQAEKYSQQLNELKKRQKEDNHKVKTAKELQREFDLYFLGKQDTSY